MKIFVLMCALSLVFLAGCDNKESKTLSSNPHPVDAKISNSKQMQSTFTPASQSDAADLSHGQSVYKSTCSICHQSGLRGAPKMGSARDWEHRLAQGKEILYKRALNGYRGEKGSMPSRGSNAKLSEEDVRAAVDYMYEHAIPAWSLEK